MPNLPDAEKERLKELAELALGNAYYERLLRDTLTPSTVTALLEEVEELKAERDADRLRFEEVQTNLLSHVQTAITCQDAAEAERDRMREALLELVNGEDAPMYHYQGMGCGIEDRNLQTDGYGGSEYGWENAASRFTEWIKGVAEAALSEKGVTNNG